MIYRKLPHGDEMISVIGMGTSYAGTAGKEELVKIVKYAVDHGINYFDLATDHGLAFEAFGEALKGQREKVYLQVHFGANYEKGAYGWTTNLSTVKKQVAWMLEKLGTDYIDFGFIHCIDEDADMDAYIANGVLDYVLEMKKKGVIRHIGMSCHNPKMGNRILDMGIIDMLMFSINAAYDHKQGDYAIGNIDDRLALYQRCEKEGVGISVMKPFSGGQLLDAEKSPFKVALTPYQCIQYALDKPAVMTVLPGYASVEQCANTLEYFNKTEEERDYSILGNIESVNYQGHCVYCKHCHPCPMGLDIALISKYYDLTKLGDEMAKEHYLNLEKHASDCIACGHCNSRCPFKVDGIQRMVEIKEYFGI